MVGKSDARLTPAAIAQILSPSNLIAPHESGVAVTASMSRSSQIEEVVAHEHSVKDTISTPRTTENHIAAPESANTASVATAEHSSSANEAVTSTSGADISEPAEEREATSLRKEDESPYSTDMSVAAATSPIADKQTIETPKVESPIKTGEATANAVDDGECNDAKISIGESPTAIVKCSNGLTGDFAIDKEEKTADAKFLPPIEEASSDAEHTENLSAATTRSAGSSLRGSFPSSPKVHTPPKDVISSIATTYHVDVDLYVKIRRPEGIVMYKLYSALMAAVSPVWCRMLYGGEHLRPDHDKWVIDMLSPEDNPYDLDIIFSIAHYKFHDIPMRPDIDQFYDIAQVA